MSFELVRQLQEKAVAVAQVCRVPGVSRSGYYAARKRSQVQPAVCEASVQLKATFAASGGAYGSRQLRTAMASRGVVMGLYRLRPQVRKHSVSTFPGHARRSASKSRHSGYSQMSLAGRTCW